MEELSDSLLRLDNRPRVVLYLDYDGVLHDDAVYLSRRHGIHIRTADRTLFEWAPILDDLIGPYPGLRIVLSTSWVRVRSFNFARDHLPIGLRGRVIGATFHSREMRKSHFETMSRFAQVFADVQRRMPVRWLALDNDDVGWPAGFREHLIKTEDRLGLSDPQVQTAIGDRLEMLASQAP